ncbi:hypothetical protein ACVWWK_001351 [Bradyrhizobium sp. LB9.1b]
MNAPSFPKLPPVSWISVSQHAKPLAVRVSFIMFPSGYIGNWDKMSVRGCDRVHIRVQRMIALLAAINDCLRSTVPTAILPRRGASVSAAPAAADAVTVRLPQTRIWRIPAKHQATAARARRIAGDSVQFREGRAYRASRAFLRAPGLAVIGTFTQCVRPSRRGAGLAEKRCRMRSNDTLLFNIRISTEDEINGNVKGDV